MRHQSAALALFCKQTYGRAVATGLGTLGRDMPALMRTFTGHATADQERVSEFELKLMDITSENLGIPETEYSATVRVGPPFPRPPFPHALQAHAPPRCG